MLVAAETGWQQLTTLAIHAMVWPEIKIMETMNIALPDDMKDFVTTEVKSGGYSSTSEFVRALIRSYQEKRQAERLDTLLMEAIKSEKSPLTKKDFAHLRAEFARRAGRKA